ncbi:hypothetical protein MMC25_007026 [Agyrium rufum]|nr:hypothetical protein [Agyrium rufum]
MSLVAVASLRLAAAHTTMTDFYVDGTPMGAGTCVRMNNNIQEATFPISSVTSDDMACGVNGQNAAARVCSANAGSTLTFEYRSWPDGTRPGSIDASHKGPCAVYMKSVSSATANDTAVGPGWFKIFAQDYDETSSQWCTEKIIANNGLLSFILPSNLPAGYNLVRSELLALQQADKSPADPQFYVGCAQIFLNSTGSSIPQDTVEIPGYINMETNAAALTFSIYDQPMKLPYPMFGPPIYQSLSTVGSKPGMRFANAKVTDSEVKNQVQGLAPAGCVLQNDNWCGIEVSNYSDEAGCWNASTDCWNQATTCYNSAGPTGSTNCPIWETKCKGIQSACNTGDFSGPPNKGTILTPPLEKLAMIPAPMGSESSANEMDASPSVGTTADAGETSADADATSSVASNTMPETSNEAGDAADHDKGESIDQCGSNNAGLTCANGMCCSQAG